MIKFPLKILGVILFFYVLGFYFGDFNIGYINVKAKMRSMCQCQILQYIETEYYQLRHKYENQKRKSIHKE